MADDTAKKSDKKPAAKKAAAPNPKTLSDADLVKGLMAVQRRKLTTADFASVTRTIKLLSE